MFGNYTHNVVVGTIPSCINSESRIKVISSAPKSKKSFAPDSHTARAPNLRHTLKYLSFEIYSGAALDFL